MKRLPPKMVINPMPQPSFAERGGGSTINFVPKSKK